MPNYNATTNFKVIVIGHKMSLYRTVTIDGDDDMDVHDTDVENTTRTLRERGLNNSSSLGIDAYMGLERLLLRCGHEIPFIQGYTTGHVCNIVANTVPVNTKDIEKYFWNGSTACGFNYNRRTRGWKYFML